MRKAKLLFLNFHSVQCYGLSPLAQIWFITACHFAEGKECDKPFEKHMFRQLERVLTCGA